jgi:hypothetical protein
MDAIVNDATRLLDAAFHSLATPPQSKNYTNIRVTVINNSYGSPKGWLRRTLAKIF